MSKIIQYLFVALWGMTLIGCQPNEGKIEAKFNLTTEAPTIKELNVSEILKPIDMVLNNNYLCLLHEEESSGDQIYVFDTDNLDFLYKFSKRGSGPEETLAIDLMKTMRGDSIDLIDQANYKKLTYVLTTDSARLVETKHLDLPNLGPLQESYWINDSVIAFNTSGGDLLTYNDKGNAIIDQVNISDLVKGIPAENIKKLGSFNFSATGKDVFVGLRFFNDIFKFKIDDDFKFIREDDLSVSSEGIDTENIFNNHGYYSFINSSDNYVLAQYYGYQMKELQPFPINLNGRNLKYDLILFDKDLKPLHKFKTDADILRAYLDEDKKRIYFLEAFEDFEQLKYIEF